jgi:hypothetical protein
MEFLKTRPPIFVKEKEPLEADEWIHVMEHKFGLIRCTETQKPLFAAQQLRGPTSTWWENFVSIHGALHSRWHSSNEVVRICSSEARR